MTSNSLPKSLYIFHFDITSELAHFRDISTHTFFKTLLAPPRTTIVGIIGAALGYDEKQTIELADNIYVGINVLSLNGYLNEIVTIINQKRDGEKTPVMRNMLVKPMYRIFIGCKDEKTIKRIKEAILTPTYPLYLGISDCLAYITKTSEIKEINAIDATQFNCIIPYDERIPYKYCRTSKSGFIVVPEIVRTVRSFILTEKGRKPQSYIDLLMFYNCKIELEKPIRAYNVDESICMI